MENLLIPTSTTLHKDSNTSISIDWSQITNKYNHKYKQKQNNTNTGVNLSKPSKSFTIIGKRQSKNGKVNALRTLEQVKAVKNYFLHHENDRPQNKSYGIRNYCLVTFGMNTALRASDILQFTIGELILGKDINGELIFRENISIKEKKTKKMRNIYLNNSVKEAITMYLNSLPEYSLDDFIFKSNKTIIDPNTGLNIQQPIQVSTFGRLMRQCGKDLNLELHGIHLGSHSCRKTWTRLNIVNNPMKPMTVIAVSDVLNHSNLKQTYTYADISADEQRKLFMENEI